MVIVGGGDCGFNKIPDGISIMFTAYFPNGRSRFRSYQWQLFPKRFSR